MEFSQGQISLTFCLIHRAMIAYPRQLIDIKVYWEWGKGCSVAWPHLILQNQMCATSTTYYYKLQLQSLACEIRFHLSAKAYMYGMTTMMLDEVHTASWSLGGCVRETRADNDGIHTREWDLIMHHFQSSLSSITLSHFPFLINTPSCESQDRLITLPPNVNMKMSSCNIDCSHHLFIG